MREVKISSEDHCFCCCNFIASAGTDISAPIVVVVSNGTNCGSYLRDVELFVEIRRKRRVERSKIPVKIAP